MWSYLYSGNIIPAAWWDIYWMERRWQWSLESVTVKGNWCRGSGAQGWCHVQLSPLHESGVQRERTQLKTPTYDLVQVDSTWATGAPGIPRWESRITEAAVLEPKSPKREAGRRRRNLWLSRKEGPRKWDESENTRRESFKDKEMITNTQCHRESSKRKPGQLLRGGCFCFWSFYK